MSYLNGNYKAENSADPELSVLLTRKQPKVIPSAPKCSKCNKSVYAAEETRAANQIFHKLCFKCTSCNKLLQPNLITEHAGDLYCKSCYAKQFGPKGYGYGCGAGTLSMENGHSLTSSNNLVKSNSTENENTPSSNSETNITSSMSCSSISSIYSNSSLTNRLERKTTLPLASLNSNNSCARCNKVVYAAEKVSAAGHHYHKLCFSCNNCKKLLNSMNCCDNSEGEVFCKACYGKLYGPKGVGYGIGAGALKTN